MTITSQQFNKLATKKDLEKLATKKELKKLEQKIDDKASKKDLKELRQESKKDLEKFATKAFAMFVSKEDLKESERRITEKVDEKFDKILIAVDGVAKEQQDSRMERAANIGAHDRIEEDIVKTNKRVTIIEKKLETVSVVA